MSLSSWFQDRLTRFAWWRVRLENRFTAPDRPTPVLPAAEARGVIVSFYMPNIRHSVVAAQRRVLERLVPRNIAIAQIAAEHSYAVALTEFMRRSRYRTVLFLDIDCVPIARNAIRDIFTAAELGQVVGAARRAPNIDNGGHIYAAPFCLAISRTAYAALGSPSFAATQRGDVGEEITYAAEERGFPLQLLWPTQSEDARWDLAPGITFGHATTYEGGFWHAFEIRDPRRQKAFVRRCNALLRRTRRER